MEEDYLGESFEPKSLRVAQLRRVLVEHGVRVQSHLKKAELCELFEKHIKAKREQLLRERESGQVVKIEKATDSSFSHEASSEKSGSPFSDVNDFQNDENARPRKRKIEEESTGRKKSGKKSKKRASAEPARAKKQESKDNTSSPLVNKLRSKSPSKKSPLKPLAIEAFESSSSSSSDAASSSSDDLDFSLRRKAASPDLSKLKVSPEFAKKLAKASSSQGSNRSQSSRGASRESEMETTPQRLSASADKSSVRESSEPKDRSFKDLPSFAPEGKVKGESKEEEPSGASTPTRGPSAQSSHQSSPHLSVPDFKEVAGDAGSEGPSSPDKKFSAEEDETVESSEAEEDEESISVENLSEQQDESNTSKSRSSIKTNIKEAKESAKEFLLEKAKEHPVPQRAWLRALGKGIWNLSVFLMVMIPILFGLWYREERIQIGYCGHEINLPTFENTNDSPLLIALENFLDNHRPQCLPCPENAICYPYMKIKCRPDYVVTQSKWSLQGIFPVSDYCAKDTKRQKLIAEVVRKSLELLRTKNANVKCGEGANDFESGITEEDLYEIFFESRAPSISDEDDIPAESHDLSQQEEHIQPLRKDRLFRSTSKKYIGLKCKFEKEVHQTYQRFKYVIWIAFALTVIIKTVTFKLRSHFKRQQRTEALTQQVVAKLQKSAKESSESRPPYMSTVQLRDVLLSDVVDLKLKNKLWNSVIKKLEHNNTNVKSRLMELHGEIMKCWEWVGPLQEEDQD
ncbi:KLTH0G04928p [Lachancea thermotolerans CBS 6340]|uniref:KLTH0G04928p n=1 Tax=Lachancea thermotolerans (strain ATCC 56472 / CBS 6340 / NRRL Y-8284) TaxID=559295 RepID=C5DM04_LACTC|nr:KLTH0G04928p [Lachancea thermotolerans CBS 6340]CAR24815.1 KLTH0G04928p [Lachancea thermotolerans CBS 6340]